MKSDIQFNLSGLVLLTVAIAAAVALSGCSSTKIENATFDRSTINTATWKSNAGAGESQEIEATTSPRTEATVE